VFPSLVLAQTLYVVVAWADPHKLAVFPWSRQHVFYRIGHRFWVDQKL